MEEKVFSLREFRGLCESPDGDRELKPGEAAIMRNFQVSREGNLRKRPGSRSLVSLCEGRAVSGIWCGSLEGRERIIAACGDMLWEIVKGPSGFEKIRLGPFEGDREPHFIPFGGRLYILNGTEYREYDGKSLRAAEGYVPLIMISVAPSGGGEKLEGINLLSPKRRVRLSPDGKSGSFILPEHNISALHYVKDLKSAADIPDTEFDFDALKGTIAFKSVPEANVNSIELCYSMPCCGREKVQKMRWGEKYNGRQDSRLFLCGSGTNEVIYSGLDSEGRERGDYFPEMNFMRLGDENSPVTGLIRHHSTLLCFKSDSVWSLHYSLKELPETGKTAAFYCAPIHRSLGNAAPGQLCIIDNCPRSLHGAELYSWHASGAYGDSGYEERKAQRCSDRIYKSLSEFDFSRCLCFDDDLRQEYYICCGDKCLVQNYARDAWYSYSGLSICSMANSPMGLLFGNSSGSLCRLSHDYKSDDGRAIDCLWESGAMAFGAEHMRKYSASLWLGIKSEARGEIKVSVRTDRSASCGEKTVSTSLSSFADADFARWSFSVSRGPRMRRLRIRAKKFVFYKLILRSCSAGSTVTLPAAEILLRCSGAAR